MEQLRPSDFQIAVARVFFGLKASEGYVVAGGAGLLASELVNRPTQDLDFFTHLPVETVAQARDAFLEALTGRGWTATVLVDAPTFCRMHVVDRDDEVLVDLALDSPPKAAPMITLLGPTLVPLELAGRKLLALFGRAEARDFADVFVLAKRFDKEALLAEAAADDAGFDRRVLAEMMGTLGRFADEEIPLPDAVVGDARAFFAVWANELNDR
ncbi:MAG: nucleotidyl transferase AbiEii/AbiGii toxin family protein [Actinomycetes bacterium]